MKVRINPISKRFLIFILGVILTALIVGFIVFVILVSRLDIPKTLPKADGIVVWTGKGGDRVTTALGLLEKKHGERLLISGTNAELSRDTIINTLNINPSLADCCIDMDQAVDTVDNAEQTANWAKALNYDHIILVTSAYHMPRAEIEIGTAAGRLGITAYPVKADSASAWWKSGASIKRMTTEYGKLILSFIRNNHQRGTPPPKPSPKNSS